MVVLGLGSNMDDRYSNMKKMEAELEKILVGPIRKSPLYESEPVGVEGHPVYLNRIIAGNYNGAPDELLILTQKIEQGLGRANKGELQPRTADIDILLFNNIEISSERLTIPHHALFERRFEIEGVQVVVPEMVIPGKGMKFLEYEIPKNIMEQELKVIDEGDTV